MTEEQKRAKAIYMKAYRARPDVKKATKAVNKLYQAALYADPERREKEILRNKIRRETPESKLYHAAYSKRYEAENRELMNAKAAKYRASKLQASPAWADKQYIEDIYTGAKEIEAIWKGIGITKKMHVDHIVPLQSNVVCGLHNEFNLQLLTESENCSKGNTF